MSPHAFDHVVVGGGTVGKVVAARLSEDPSVTVIGQKCADLVREDTA
ncbi:hypothetical protein [Streptomyces sp. NPDC057838]